MDFYQEVLKEKDNILKDLMKILKIDTVLKQEYNPKSEFPFGKNLKEAIDFIETLAQRDGLKFENVLNHVAEVEIGEGQDIFGVLAHLDVVPATGKWNTDPFTPTIIDNKLYARGVVDDKGSCILCYYCLKILKKLNIPLKKRIRLILGVDEESGSRCIEKYLEVKEEPSLAFSPDADFPMIYGEKGIMGFKICGKTINNQIISIHSGTRTNLVPDETILVLKNDYTEEFKDFLIKNQYKGELIDNKTYRFIGKSSHAMMPSNGLNSNFLCFQFLEEIKIGDPLITYFNKYFLNDVNAVNINANSYCEEMKELTLNVGTFHLENNEFVIGINIRYPFENDFNNVIEKMNTINQEYGYSLQDISNSKPHKVDKNSFLVEKLLEAYKKHAKDQNPEPFTIGGGTYARMFKNGVAFGPTFKNREDVVHKENEYAYLEDLWLACTIFLEGIYNICA